MSKSFREIIPDMKTRESHIEEWNKYVNMILERLDKNFRTVVDNFPGLTLEKTAEELNRIFIPTKVYVDSLLIANTYIKLKE